MSIFSSIFLIVLGLLGAPSLLLNRIPAMKGFVTSITPFVGWLGVIAALWGLWVTIDALIWIRILGWFPVVWLTWFAVGIVLVVLGFLLGFPVLNQLALSKNADAAKKADMVRAKLATYQTLFSIVAIGLGIWSLVVELVLYRI